MSKLWGSREFWGVGGEYDPQWVLDAGQADLQTDLIQLCRTTLRPNAVKSDEAYVYPRANMDALASMGLLGLIVPRDLGGRGQNHRCAAMIVETIARYGCPSTAMVYVMHLGACSSVLLRCHDNETLRGLMGRLDRDKLIGTEIYSDPATGGHLWYPLSSKCWQQEDGRFKALKYGSWATSAGFADWYVVQMASPNFSGDYSNLTNFLFYKDEIRASTDEWSALGMHGNQSGPTVAEAVLTPDRLIGPIGDGAASNDETVNPYFLLNSSCCWNGISMATIDLAKRHVTNRGHSDVGLRVCDYPVIQDYFGEALSSTNSCRLMAFSIAAAMDQKTNNNDWSIHADHTVLPRASMGQWLWQLKFESAKNVCAVTDKMLHACGGSGYKTELGLERLLRDGKAGWVMGPSNEVLRNLVGRTALLGMANIDLWAQKVDDRALNNEVKKLSIEQKTDLANRLLKQVEQSKQNESNAGKLENDKFFDHPFNTAAATTESEGQGHEAVLRPDEEKALQLTAVRHLTADKKVARLEFALSKNTAHLGTLPGQYVEILVPDNGRKVSRYMSPVSAPIEDRLEIVVRYENQGVLARFLKHLEIGQMVEFRGPCGGFEYLPNKLTDLIFICGGTGVTPAIQVLRAVSADKSDTTRVTLLYQVKNRENLIFEDELDNYNTDGRFKVVCTLQDPDGDWTGPEGEIGRTFLGTHLPQTEGGRRKVVMCGGPAMLLSCLDALYQLGYRSEEVFIYGPFGAQQIRAVYGTNAKLATHLA